MIKNIESNRLFSCIFLIFFVVVIMAPINIKAAQDSIASSTNQDFISTSTVVIVSNDSKVDSDGDGLNNSLELKFKTDPLNSDSDNDGYKDGEEVYWGYNPLSSTSKKLSQKIIIDLKNQKLKYLVSDQVLKEFIISSGKASMKTPVGTFKIINKNKKAWSNTYKLWMPYWLGLGNGSFGIHELPIWPSGYREGASHLGKPVSHGCVRLGIGAAQYIYERVGVGTNVVIN